MWKIGTQMRIHTIFFLIIFDYFFTDTCTSNQSMCVSIPLKYFRILIIKNSCKEEKKKKKNGHYHTEMCINKTDSNEQTQNNVHPNQTHNSAQLNGVIHIFSVCVCCCKTRVVCFRRSCACWFSLISAFELIKQSAKYMHRETERPLIVMVWVEISCLNFIRIWIRFIFAHKILFDTESKYWTIICPFLFDFSASFFSVYLSCRNQWIFPNWPRHQPFRMTLGIF